MSQYNPTALYMRNPVRETLRKLWEYPLTVIEAPMGYGKTTAVKEYLTGCLANVLWQTITNDSASVFWHGFCRLLKKIDPSCAESMADLGVPTNSIFVETAVELFESMEFPDKSVIVLDDYHLLSSETVDQFLECLVRNAPANLQIVIISRSMFGQNTIDLARNGYCHVIDKGQFEFTQDEIIEYYRLCGICLKPTEAVELYNYTEGWISALYLSMLSFLREGRIEHQVSLHELIEKVVYRQCATDVKEFLLTICIFDSFTLEQARVMWPNQNVEEIINYLI
ncbi:MAG TPA: helix-turn-helix transcriptional regulator, partial [Negativicutes bacterium]|nr:helix-turn-helix transcriptional regulator [Negativicutes bacterium]